MRVALYLRCSTSKQDLDSQRREVVAWAEREGHTYTLYEDFAQSGFKREREKVQLMMQDAAAGKFEAVGGLEVSRLGRSIKQIYELIEGLVERKVDIYLAKSGTRLDYHSLEGRALLGGLALAAELEGILIRERNERGRKKIKDEHIRVGRKRQEHITGGAVVALRGQGRSIAEIARLLHSNKGTVHRRLKEERSISAHLRNVTESNVNTERQEQNRVDSVTPFQKGG